MRLQLKIIALLLLILWNGKILATTEDNSHIQIIIHLLDYISRDYPAAVEQGEIINQVEYVEMEEFSAKSKELAEEMLPGLSDSLAGDFSRLQSLIANKAAHEKIREVSQHIKAVIIEVTGFETAPPRWPDLQEGKDIYVASCVSCHGLNGNGQGQLAAGLEPPPTNFLNDTFMAGVSPFQAYNTTRLGIEGTAMVGFDSLTDQQVWDVAFYIKSMRFDNGETDSTELKQWFEKASAEILLPEVATMDDQEILIRLGEGQQAQRKLRALRSYTPEDDSTRPLDIARNYLQRALQAYASGETRISRQHALAAYLEGIELVEARIKANDPKLVVELEQQMFNIRNAVEREKSTDEVKKEIESGLVMIQQAEQIIKDAKLTYWLSFLLSASIIIREGLEAFLIIALIITLIRSSGARRALPWLHGGWLTAMTISLTGWFLSDWVISISGKNREIMEGAVALLAVLVLISVGIWLHDQSHAKKWKAFIEKKVTGLLQSRNMWGLAFFSFIVVFREAFESILFLQAIKLETPRADQSSIGLGVMVAFILIAVFVILFLKYSKKIPVRQLFRYSSWLITLLAIILMGQGIHALQESGWISVTSFPVRLRVDWLGLFPTMETILSQIALASILLTVYYFSNRKANKPAVLEKNF